VKNRAITSQRSAEHYEPILDEGIHDASVLSPADLLAQIS
jgi:hypothetical protein